MLTWVAIVIAAFALMRVWHIYSHDKMKRELKQRQIIRRLREITEKESQDKKPENKKSNDSDD